MTAESGPGEAGRDALAEVTAERDVLAQAMWDARTVLGFDPDGDTRFHTTDWHGVAACHVQEAREVRADLDMLLDHLEQTDEAPDRRVRAEALRDVAADLDRHDETCVECEPGDHVMRAISGDGLRRRADREEAGQEPRPRPGGTD